jgi:hypothetical protein
MEFIVKVILFAIFTFALAVVINFTIWCFRPEPAFFKDTFENVYAGIVLIGLLIWFFED